MNKDLNNKVHRAFTKDVDSYGKPKMLMTKVNKLRDLLSESRNVLIMCSLLDKSNTCNGLVDKIDNLDLIKL